MVLIPPEAGVRLRMQTDATLLQPTAPVREIQPDLPDLLTGQTFSARIQEVLPDNTYRALVAGKSLTLHLPEGAKAGDNLELVVIDRTPRLIVAQLADSEQANAAAYPHATLSRAGKMIGDLLLPEGKQPTPALLNRGRPLLTQPPTAEGTGVFRAPAELSATLSKAVSQSGLFYEAHQAQWVTGKLTTEELLREPQARHSSPSAFIQNGLPVPSQRLSQEQSPAASNQATAGSENSRTSSSAPQLATTAMPEDVRSLVQQQLDASVTQRMAWHGEVWPQQAMDWEIERDTVEGDGTGEGIDENAWRTSLRLMTPRLGEVSAILQLNSAGIRLMLSTPYGASAADLRDEAPALAASLEAAGIPLLSFHVRHESGNEQG
jgi:hypothetical protein